ncbi:MAG: hypothetical protein ACO1RX_16265 [Candidatus Sericytochromatia bacterium]
MTESEKPENAPENNLNENQLSEILRQQRALPSAEFTQRFESELEPKLQDAPPAFAWWKRPWVAAAAALAIVLVSVPLMLPQQQSTQTASRQEAMNLGAGVSEGESKAVDAAAPAASSQVARQRSAAKQSSTAAQPKKEAPKAPTTAEIEKVTKPLGVTLKALGNERYELQVASASRRELRHAIRKAFPVYYRIDRIKDDGKQTVYHLIPNSQLEKTKNR